MAALSDMPVMLPPGCAKLLIRPVATGSPAPAATTVGIPVSFIAAAAGQPRTTAASTLFAAMSLARCGSYRQSAPLQTKRTELVRLSLVAFQTQIAALVARQVV